VSPETENWALDRAAAVILIEVLPVFATVAVCEVFLPTTRLPKLKLLGVTWTAAAGGVPDLASLGLTIPAQPVIQAIDSNIKKTGSARTHERRLALCCDRSCRFRNSVLSKLIRPPGSALQKEHAGRIRGKNAFNNIALYAFKSARKPGTGGVH